jgi:hypothetical protein
VIIVPATAELFYEYFGDIPIAKPSMRAYFMMVDDKPAAVCGFIRMRGGRMLTFTEAKEGMYESHALSIIKFSKAILKIADDNNWVMVADRDTTQPRSAQFLAYLGFEFTEDGEYIRWPVSQLHSPT